MLRSDLRGSTVVINTNVTGTVDPQLYGLIWWKADLKNLDMLKSIFLGIN